MFQIALHLCGHVQTMHTSINYWLLNGGAWTSQQLRDSVHLQESLEEEVIPISPLPPPQKH